ncbi:MAG TPA: asparagine synthase (glutamine-hydrolyzing) [Anaerolineae bacterium]|nr:asparagine synthase (glutamine-hydrolyzing) [Anaerolineae bacterium]
MCGICGLGLSTGAASTTEIQEKVRQMNARLVHRGPDGEGFHFAPGVGLAMRRLAIIDLQTGDQPIPNEDKSLWIVFNGEIYNFPQLRKDLIRRGHRFRTRTDTETIVHLYEEYGPECVHHLRGMFAFALWDAPRRRLFIARDRLGQKPLYYTVQDGTLYFASELPALLTVLSRTPEVSLEALDLYLALQYIPEPLTPYQGVYKLPAAHLLLWHEGRLEVQRYWDLHYTPKWTLSEADLLAELRERVREAVRLRLISDVPLGAHLSGGLDSSIMVAVMAALGNGPVKTFSVGFEEEAFSELAHARTVAQRFATDHHEFVLTYGDIPSTLETLVAHLGEPLADPSVLPLYHLSRLTREHVTVALNGDGGDEAFAGYPRYWWDPWANRYLRLPRWFTQGVVPWLVRYLPDRGDRPVGHSLVNGLKRLAQLPQVDPRASLLRWGSYFGPELREALWRPEHRAWLTPRRAETWLVEHFTVAQAESLLDRTLYADVHTYLPGDLLVKADRMTMAASLEGRSPFLDHELMAWAARLPQRWKVRGLTGKVALRKAFADQLPPEILRRGKQGFGVPVGAWLRGPLRPWMQELLLGDASPLRPWIRREVVARLVEEHATGREDHGKRLWALAVWAMWWAQQ